MEATLLLGAVAYDAKVVTIWEGIRAHFQAQGAPMDFALFSNYERQVEALLAGHVDVAWNTPLAHVRVQGKLTVVTVTLTATDGTVKILRLPSGAPTLGEIAVRALHGMVGNRLLID